MSCRVEQRAEELGLSAAGLRCKLCHPAGQAPLPSGWLMLLPLLCRAMGESNGLIKRRQELPRGVALATAAAYAGLFAEEDGSIPGGRL